MVINFRVEAEEADHFLNILQLAMKLGLVSCEIQVDRMTERRWDGPLLAGPSDVKLRIRRMDEQILLNGLEETLLNHPKVKSVLDGPEVSEDVEKLIKETFE